MSRYATTGQALHCADVFHCPVLYTLQGSQSGRPGSLPCIWNNLLLTSQCVHAGLFASPS